MYFKQVLNERCGCASYVLASRRTHDAAIIDPAIETEPYDALLRERGFRLEYVIDTHIHAVNSPAGAARSRSMEAGSSSTNRRGSPNPFARSPVARGWGLGRCASASFLRPANA